MISEHPETEMPETEMMEAGTIEAGTIQAGAPEADSPEAAEADEQAAGREPAEDEAAAEADERDMDASDFDNLRLVEALLFASAEPLAPAQLARFLPDDCKVEPLLADLAALYANRGVNLVKRGGRWAFRTAEDLAPRMELEQRVVRKLSRVALETLAVIAYHQPVTRAEIEEIRGVALSKGTLDALLEIGWIRPKGRRKTPGRPVTWGTSEAFLDHFGLDSLEALPGVEELKAAGLLDARPALTALSDRGLLPAAGEVAPEEVEGDDEDEDSEVIEGSERELLEATFGENLLPHEVELATAGGADEAPEEAEAGLSGGADEAAGPSEDDEVGEVEEDDEDDLEDAAGDDEEHDALDREDDDEDDDVRHRQRRSAGRA